MDSTLQNQPFGEEGDMGVMPGKGGMGGKGDEIADTGWSSWESLGTIGVQRRKPLWKLQCVRDVEKQSDGESNVWINCMLQIYSIFNVFERACGKSEIACQLFLMPFGNLTLKWGWFSGKLYYLSQIRALESVCYHPISKVKKLRHKEVKRISQN